MPHLFCLARIEGGDPLIDQRVTPYHGLVHCATVDNWAAYLFSGTGAQLTALAALPAAQLIPICAVTKSGDVKWAELDTTIPSAVRTKLNTWLTNHGQPTIPAGWTYRQVVVAIFTRLHERFDLENFYVVAPEDASGPPAMPEGAGPSPRLLRTETQPWTCQKCGRSNNYEVFVCDGCGAPMRHWQVPETRVVEKPKRRRRVM